jgi:putative zinc finger/helix-turn-helix YgiT family protein
MTVMKCSQCGAAMKSKRENVRYEASGLSTVTLENVEVRRCPSCGEYEIVIPRIDDLHRAIAEALIRKRGRLAPEEIRFLRKYLGWSGVDFAAHMGTTAETVSRWEQGAVRMGVTADRLLRLMVASRDPVRDYPLEVMREVAKASAKPVHVRASVAPTGWQTRAA